MYIDCESVYSSSSAVTESGKAKHYEKQLIRYPCFISVDFILSCHHCLKTWFGHDFPAGQFASVRIFLIAATTRYSGFFLLSLVTRFACGIGQLAKIWI